MSECKPLPPGTTPVTVEIQFMHEVGGPAEIA